jgi:hypothetical protein
MKEKLIEKAKKLEFASEILWNYPYKYSNREYLRYALWMEELRKWLRHNHDMYIETPVFYSNATSTYLWITQLYYVHLDKEDYTINEYPSYDEALEAILYESLEILDNYLNKQKNHGE